MYISKIIGLLLSYVIQEYMPGTFVYKVQVYIMNTSNIPQGNSISYSLGIYDYKLLNKDTFNIPQGNSIRYSLGIY